MAVCILELARENEEEKKQVARLMERVPGLRQKIAGKSIPMEVCLLSLLLIFLSLRSSPAYPSSDKLTN